MIVKDWQTYEETFLKQNYQMLSNAEMGHALGRSKESVNKRMFLMNQEIKRPQAEKIYTVLSKVSNTRKKDEKIALISEALKLIAARPKELIRSPEQVTAIKSRIAGNRFQKGVKPWNAGTKGVKKANSGSFQKGNKNSPTTLYDNAISIKKEKKTGKKYKMIRTAPNQWEYLQRYNWEKNFGPIPDGYIVAFSDGNSLNCEPENLICITEHDHMLRCAAKQKMKYKHRRETRERINSIAKEMKGISLPKKSTRGTRMKTLAQPSNQIPIRIDAKTVIFAKPGQDIEKVKADYLARINNPSPNH